MGISSAWEPVDGPPDALSFGLVPIDDGSGRARPVMLWAWLLDDRGGVLVQPVLRGQDEPLPWGLRTTLADRSVSAPAARALRGFDALVMPMVIAVEALAERGLAPEAIAGMRTDAMALADDASAGISAMRHALGQPPPAG
jgi:hypothetical protein